MILSSGGSNPSAPVCKGDTMKPATCLDESCKGSDHCSMCINRNVAAKRGYELIQLIEKIPASVEQTEAVTAAQSYIEYCSKLSDK